MQSNLSTKLAHLLHVGIIMDGNGRWATRRGLSRLRGHEAGVEAIRRVVEAAPDHGVGTLTLYAFSTDNWRRPKAEVTALMAHPKGLAFADLKQLCALTDGNLSRHLQVLQEAGLVEVIKGYEGNRPHTTCRLTKTGRRRFLDYLAVLERLVRDAAKAAGKEGSPLPRLGILST